MAPERIIIPSMPTSSFTSLSQAVDLARRNIEPRAFRAAQHDMLEHQLEEARDFLKSLVGCESEIAAMLERKRAAA